VKFSKQSKNKIQKLKEERESSVSIKSLTISNIDI